MRRASFIILLFCASCATAPAAVDSIGNSTRPSWLISTGEAVITPETKVCLEISQGELWQPEVDPIDLSRNLETSLRIVVDDSTSQRAEIDIAIPDVLTPVFDDGGMKIGSHGGIITACFAAPSALGEHSAIVEISPRQGIVLSYAWRFRVENVS